MKAVNLATHFRKKVFCKQWRLKFLARLVHTKKIKKSINLSNLLTTENTTPRSINQSINQKRIRATKVTNVTARPLLQC